MKAPLKGRAVKCRDCYQDMVQQKDIQFGWQWMCERCGRTWNIPVKALVLGKDEKDAFRW